jgi:taurine dioxygenase
MGAFVAQDLSPAMGVELSGFDFRQPLDGAMAEELNRLFDRHRLLLVRGQDLSGDDQLRLCRHLRTVSDDTTFVSNVEAGAFHRECELLYHSDYTFRPWPLDGISLYALEIGDGASPTRFVNTALAYAHMPEQLRERLHDLEVVMQVNIKDGDESTPIRTARLPEHAPAEWYPKATWPAIRVHPRTGDRYVVPGSHQASHFVGLTHAESDVILDELLAFLYSGDFLYEHHWAVGDLVIWDNLVLQHGRPENPATTPRTLRRVTMCEKSQDEINAGTAYSKAWRQAQAAAG